DLKEIGYKYDALLDKWNIGDMAADFIFCGNKTVDFALPGTLKQICYYDAWKMAENKRRSFPIFDEQEYLDDSIEKSPLMNFVMVDCFSEGYPSFDKKALFKKLAHDFTAVICLSSTNQNAMQSIRRMFLDLIENNLKNPVIIICDSNKDTMDESLIHYSVETGAL